MDLMVKKIHDSNNIITLRINAEITESKKYDPNPSPRFP